MKAYSVQEKLSDFRNLLEHKLVVRVESQLHVNDNRNFSISSLRSMFIDLEHL